jgi:CBS domain-containing protein
MKKNEPIKTIMSASPVTVQLGSKLSAVREILDANPFHHVPVVEGEKLVGMISHQDILRVAMGDPKEMDKRELDALLDYSLDIESVMTREPVTVGMEAMVRDAAAIFAEGRFHSLPVMDDGKLVGIVTSTDVVRYFLSQY